MVLDLQNVKTTHRKSKSVNLCKCQISALAAASRSSGVNIQFLKHLYTTNNYCISLCARLAMEGSGSSLGNNLTVLSDVFHTPRYTLPEYEIDSDVRL